MRFAQLQRPRSTRRSDGARSKDGSRPGGAPEGAESPDRTHGQLACYLLLVRVRECRVEGRSLYSLRAPPPSLPARCPSLQGERLILPPARRRPGAGLGARAADGGKWGATDRGRPPCFLRALLTALPLLPAGTSLLPSGRCAGGRPRGAGPEGGQRPVPRPLPRPRHAKRLLRAPRCRGAGRGCGSLHTQRAAEGGDAVPHR